MMGRILLTMGVLSIWVCACKGPSGPMGPNGDGYESLSNPHIQPVVVFTDPSGGGIGTFDSYNQFQIRFNKYMDIASLKRAIRFSSALGDVSTDTSAVSSSTGDLITVSAGGSGGTRDGFLWRIAEPYT